MKYKQYKYKTHNIYYMIIEERKKFNSIIEKCNQTTENYAQIISDFNITNTNNTIIHKDNTIQSHENTTEEYLKLTGLYYKKNKYIKLKNEKNKYVRVNLSDYDMLMHHKWYLNSNGNVENSNKIVMQNLIMNPPKGQIVHHRDYDKLNNTRMNLEILDHRKIKLSDNKGEVLVSIEDYDLLSKDTWHLNSGGYPANGKKELMHRIIMKEELLKCKTINPDITFLVDHIEGEKLDNRRKYLRVTNHAVNAQNRLKTQNEKSTSYKGISFYENEQRYFARITINGYPQPIGNYITLSEAVFAYDMYIVHNKLDNSNLIIPEKREEYLKSEYTPPQQREFKSKYNGVGIDKKRFVCRINHPDNRPSVYRGTSEIDCAKACDKFIVDRNLKGIKLNFQEDYPDYETRIIKTLCEDFEGFINKGIKGEEFIKFKDNVVRLTIKSANKSTYDEIVLVDKEIYEIIKYYGCSINTKKNKEYVTVNAFNNGTNVSLHRLVMDFPVEGMDVDHIHGNKLDNRKKALREVPHSQNSQNRVKNPNSSNTYTGVNKKNKKWVVTIGLNNDKIPLGSFDIEEYGARMRDLYIMGPLKGSIFKLAFEWTNDEIIFWKTQLKSPLLPDDIIYEY